jgi:hypothetical protein
MFVGFLQRGIGPSANLLPGRAFSKSPQRLC